ncbi:hypothetical protein CDL15_Pgr001450 [Punica granatum]|uniref:TF-B3 domain-containing protein n=1 Tax=Punica granatum TaxID=22663 RepID=A0A218WL15_PUNGR|nr:hypothetical protein CDL15_Pgr001450 [Punica granatum]
MAYDSAAINLRSRHSHRNFPWTTDSVEEPNFQSLFSQEAVLSMIKNWSYPSKFVSYHRVRSEKNGRCRLGPAGPNPVVGIQAGEGGAGFLCRQLFQKELTPSDVGKLNRLVIPKKYAVNQSFVITRGWSQFVKEKASRANDRVSFYLCECTDDPMKENRTFCMIDVCRSQSEQLIGAMDRRSSIGNEVEEVIEEEPGTPVGSPSKANKGFRLFGVQIN